MEMFSLKSRKSVGTNQLNDKQEMIELNDYVESNINHAQLYEVNKVTPDVIKTAATKLSDDKTDPVYSYSSDCIKNGTDRLYAMLAIAIQSFLIHGPWHCSPSWQL